MEIKSFAGNVSTSVSTPIEYYKILVLQRLNDLNEGWESYSKQKHLGIQSDLNIVQARTESLYNALRPFLKRKFKEENIKEIDKTLFGDKEATEKQLRNIFNSISEQLDADRITRMDTRAVYDGTRVEEENKNFGD